LAGYVLRGHNPSGGYKLNLIPVAGRDEDAPPPAALLVRHAKKKDDDDD